MSALDQKRTYDGVSGMSAKGHGHLVCNSDQVRQGRISPEAIERDFPHYVEVIVPLRGFGRS